MADGSSGQGKALKLNFHPVRNEIPVFVGAIGRKSVEMAAEICDGWIPIFFSPDAFEETWGEHLEAGFAKGGRSREDLEVSPPIQVAIDGDLEAARAMVRAGLLLYLGGMGAERRTSTSTSPTGSASARSPTRSRRSTWTASARTPTTAIPDELVDATSLIGTEDEVAERLDSFARHRRRPRSARPCSPTRPSACTRSSALAALVGAGAPRPRWRAGPGRQAASPDHRRRPRDRRGTAELAGGPRLVGGARRPRPRGRRRRGRALRSDAVACAADITDQAGVDAAVAGRRRAPRRHRPLLRQRRDRDRGHASPHRPRRLRGPGRRQPRRDLPHDSRVPAAPARVARVPAA